MPLFIFVTHTATTDIYTYGPTLSLHDALPIAVPRVRLQDRPEGQGRTEGSPGADHLRGPQGQLIAGGRGRASARPRPLRSRVLPGIPQLEEIHEAGDQGPDQAVRFVHRQRRHRPHHRRSEEHTSELQSLMRISYAVFCLKKKTTR